MNDSPRSNRLNPVLIVIDREFVEQRALSPIMEVLNSLIESKLSVESSEGMLDIVIDGYNEDPRELYRIDEVRSYIAELTNLFPYWFHFCNKKSSTLVVLIKCLLPIESGITLNGIVTSKIQEGALSAIVLRLYSGMNALYAGSNIPKPTQTRVTREINVYIDAFSRTSATQKDD